LGDSPKAPQLQLRLPGSFAAAQGHAAQRLTMFFPHHGQAPFFARKPNAL